MVRGFIDAPIDQSVTDEMKQALVPMLTDAIEKHSVTEFYAWYHEILPHVKKILRVLKEHHPKICLIVLREAQGDERDDDLITYMDVDHPTEWQHENCQIRLDMHMCSSCYRTEHKLYCKKRNLYEGKVPSRHKLLRLEKYIVTE